MKKHRSILASVAALLSLTTMFAACNPDAGNNSVLGGGSQQQHEHTFSENWSNNETNHWKAATCEHGENRQDFEPHEDSDQDGKCDDCAFEMGHTHTFAEEWQSDATNHWKAATCLHTEEIGELEPHADENTDGKCDKCEAHVHVLNILGFCDICDEEVKPIDTNSVPGHITAALARKDNVSEGKVEYKYQGEIYDDHTVEYTFGTNGTYTKNMDISRSINQSTGMYDKYTVESYLTKSSDALVTGTAVTFVNGEFQNAAELSYGVEHLRGYYYSVSSLADAYGAEEILAALYEQALLPRAEITREQVIAEQNKCVFAFNLLTVNAMWTTAGGERVMVYNVHYYETSVEFAYTDNHTLTDLKIIAKHYGNDAGKEETTSLIYYPETDTFVKNGTPDTYTYIVKQIEGERTELDLTKGDQYKPSAVDFYADKAMTQKVNTIELYYGQSKTYYMGVNEGATIEMLAISPDKLLEAEDGTQTKYGFCMVENINEITFNNTTRMAEGTYTCTLTWDEVVKTFTIIVKPRIIEGEAFISVTSGATANTWNTEAVQFMFDVTGTYTFYLPEGVTMAIWNPLENGEPAAADLAACKVVGTSNTYGATVVEVELTGIVTNFRFKFDKANTDYVIGYDLPVEE